MKGSREKTSNIAANAPSTVPDGVDQNAEIERTTDCNSRSCPPQSCPAGPIVSRPLTPNHTEVVSEGSGERRARKAGQEDRKQEVRKIKLRERDFKILEALAKWGALGLGQIDAAFFRRPEDWQERMRLYFNEIDRRDYWHGAYKRMEQLRQSGLVRLERYINHHQTYLLTAAGHRLLYSWGRRLVTTSFRPVLQEAYVNHELAVAAVGLVLEETSGKEILSHRQLYETRARRQRRQPKSLIQPDLWIVDQERPCAVEVELCQKSERRYRDLWEEYRRKMPDGGKVLYLTGWDNLRDTLLKLANAERLPILYAASLGDFRAARERCVFTSFRSWEGRHDELQLVSTPQTVQEVGGEHRTEHHR